MLIVGLLANDWPRDLLLNSSRSAVPFRGLQLIWRICTVNETDCGWFRKGFRSFFFVNQSAFSNYPCDQFSGLLWRPKNHETKQSSAGTQDASHKKTQDNRAHTWHEIIFNIQAAWLRDTLNKLQTGVPRVVFGNNQLTGGYWLWGYLAQFQADTHSFEV